MQFGQPEDNKKFKILSASDIAQFYSSLFSSCSKELKFYEILPVKGALNVKRMSFIVLEKQTSNESALKRRH